MSVVSSEINGFLEVRGTPRLRCCDCSKFIRFGQEALRTIENLMGTEPEYEYVHARGYGCNDGPSPRRSGRPGFWSHVLIGDECWEWYGAICDGGYGRYHTGKNWKAHRFSYEYLVGPIPPGLALDHLCHNKRCVRPDHLEPVTTKDNNRRYRAKLASERLATP